MEVSEEQLVAWDAELEPLTPQEMIQWASKKFGKKVSFATSLGVEDQAILAMIAKLTPDLPVFTLDTGRLFQQSYDLIEKNQDFFNIAVEVLFPDSHSVQEMVNQEGVNLFYRSIENRKKCCGIRKIEPLRRALSGQDAWICGLRRGQSVTRQALKAIEWDEGNGLVKINPLCHWSEDDVWDYVRANNLPYNELHDQGFLSIGCASCTRSVKAGEDVRAGRWWWEDPEHKECGLHFVDGKLVRNNS